MINNEKVEIDPEKIKEGTAIIMSLSTEKIAVCKKDDVLMLFPILEIEED